MDEQAGRNRRWSSPPATRRENPEIPSSSSSKRRLAEDDNLRSSPQSKRGNWFQRMGDRFSRSRSPSQPRSSRDQAAVNEGSNGSQKGGGFFSRFSRGRSPGSDNSPSRNLTESDYASSSSEADTGEDEIIFEKDQTPVKYPWTGDGYWEGRKITFFCYVFGTRGDIQPLIVIAKRLEKDGHIVRFATHPDHKDPVEKQGLKFYPIEGFPPNEVIAEPLEGGLKSAITLLKKRPKYYEWYRELYKSSWSAINAPWDDGTPFKANAIMTSYQSFNALDMAEAKSIPLFLYNVFPILPTKYFRHPFGIIMEGKTTSYNITNKMSFAMSEGMFEIGLRPVQKECRRYLGLTRLHTGSRTMSGRRLAKLRVPCFGIWSPHLLPEPDDYNENYVVVGNVDRTGGLGQLPDDLMAYINKGDKPLFVGFGSMTNEEHLSNLWKATIQVIKELKISRCIFHVKKDFDKKFVEFPPQGVFVLDRPVPHALLFKYCSAALHHGGPGTFHAGFLAGIPNGVVSFVVDQPFWGDLIEKKNVGSHVRIGNVTVHKLRDVVLRLFNPTVVANARELGQQMRSEPDALDVLVEALYERMPLGPVDYRKLETTKAWKNSSTARLAVEFRMGEREERESDREMKEARRRSLSRETEAKLHASRPSVSKHSLGFV